MLWFPTVTFGQYLTGDSSVLRQNKIKRLRVYNCLDSADCFVDVYEFNRNGQLTKDVPAIVNGYDQFEYYDNGKLKTSYSKMHCCEDDTIFALSNYIYDKNWKFKYIISKQYDKGEIVKIDTSFTQPETEPITGLKNKKGQIIEQSLGDLYFPCAIIYKGNHKIKYTYNVHGLIISAKVYDSSDKLIINFSYSYEFY